MEMAEAAVDGVWDDNAEVSTAPVWARYWARSLDLALMALIGGYVFAALFPSISATLVDVTGGNNYLYGIVFFPVIIMLDALCLAAFGQTAGKLAAGIRIVTMGTGRITFGSSLYRNLQVYMKGLGLGIPIVALFTLTKAHGRVKAGEETSWDESVGTRVVIEGASFARITLTATLYILLLTGVIAWTRSSELSLDKTMPRQ